MLCAAFQTGAESPWERAVSFLKIEWLCVVFQAGAVGERWIFIVWHFRQVHEVCGRER